MIRLVPVDLSNVWKLLSLEVDEGQKTFVATNTESIVEAYTVLAAGGVALPFGIYDGDEPVGFLMIGYGDEPGEESPAFAHDKYCLWRLMIDKHKQGRGYGREAVRLALDYMKTCPAGEATGVWLSYEPENSAAKALYASFGFVENGEVIDGEAVAILTY